ncbi:hypothetical protein AVEN_210661-1 [Araneus ventricosus]|uniref:Uncharacterized protein n=1 Tax=Araneus ventricosus TaxID=182803 RepID=A0A4Y2UHN6_ARAVE|nr:hypothetical protein AVEN_210661-1 [Araneus ventricosus]
MLQVQVACVPSYADSSSFTFMKNRRPHASLSTENPSQQCVKVSFVIDTVFHKSFLCHPILKGLFIGGVINPEKTTSIYLPSIQDVIYLLDGPGINSRALDGCGFYCGSRTHSPTARKGASERVLMELPLATGGVPPNRYSQ